MLGFGAHIEAPLDNQDRKIQSLSDDQSGVLTRVSSVDEKVHALSMSSPISRTAVGGSHGSVGFGCDELVGCGCGDRVVGMGWDLSMPKSSAAPGRF